MTLFTVGKKFFHSCSRKYSLLCAGDSNVIWVENFVTTMLSREVSAASVSV